MKKKYLINRTQSLFHAMKKLHNLKFKILFVVEKNRKLLGTVTDGDLRRGLIKFKSPEVQINKVMNKKPLVSYSSNIHQDVITKAKKKQINIIPILSKTNKLIDFTILKSFNDNFFDIPVLILAGGRGKRLLPLTLNTPKPMLKINGTPILEKIISRFASNGFKNFYISVQFKKEKIINYFKKKKLRANITYLKETKPLDTAGCLGLIPKKELRPVVVINGDVITDLNPKLLIDFHLKNKNDLTICVEKYVHKVPYGVMTEKNNKVISIDEKPEINQFVNAGIYIVGKKIYKNLSKNKKISMVSLINLYARNKRYRIQSFPMLEKIVDLGKIENFKKYKYQN